MTRYDAIVIGSGPAGRRAAIQAAKGGMSVMVIEKGRRVGGVSVHTGTIPSKTLRETVLNLTGWRERGFYGSAYRVKHDIEAKDLMTRLHMTLDHEVDVLEHQFARNGVHTITGAARFVGPHEVEATLPGGDVRLFTGHKILIAVGTRPYRPANIAFDGQTILDSDEILDLPSIPRQLIGVGASIIKPCIAGTVQKTAGARKTLGFGIFYMVVNMGSLLGRAVSFFFRRRFDLTAIFGVSMLMASIAFLVVLLVYKEPDLEMGGGEKKPAKSMGEIFTGMFTVLRNGRFAMFLVVSSGFYFIYNQVYNLLPLYVKRTVELKPAMDIYTIANPFVIVGFQLLITLAFGKLPPIKSIIVGTVIIGFAMLINLAPIYMAGGVGLRMFDLLPLGSLFIVLTVALIAFGELFAAARLYEYIGSLAPPGQEGLFLGYSNIPLALGSLVGGPAGAFLFNAVMCRGAQKLPNGLLKLDPHAATLGWVILTLIGLTSAASMFGYNEWLKRH